MQTKQLNVRNKISHLTNHIQCRRFTPEQIEPRFVQRDAKTGVVKCSGYAVKWDSINQHGEQFRKGAFAQVCSDFAAGLRKVHCYYNHGWQYFYYNPLIAFRVAKITLLQEDDVGLKIELEFTPGHDLAMNVAAMVMQGTVDGFSIAFWPVSPQDYIDHGTHVEITRVDVYEISVVDDPSDSEARIETDTGGVDDAQSTEDVQQIMQRYMPPELASALTKRMQAFAEPAKPNPLDAALAALD